MDNSNLYEMWKTSPYNDANLAKKTFSYRLPVHVAARLAAIEEMFPDLSRSQVIIEILKRGLAKFEADLPKPIQERVLHELPIAEHDLPEDHPQYIEPKHSYRTVGPKVEYCDTANKYYVEYENERGNKNPKAPFKP